MDFQGGQKTFLQFMSHWAVDGYWTLILIVYPDCFVDKNVRYGTETDGAVWTCYT